MDLGFEKAGFNVAIANEFDKNMWATFKVNHPNTKLIEGDIRKLKLEDIDIEIDGIIGGSPPEENKLFLFIYLCICITHQVTI